MSNTTLTADVVAKAALAILDNELGVVKTFHRAYEEEFSNQVNGYKIGDTLSIRRPADFTIRTGATLSAQDVVEGKTTLVIDQQIGVDFQFSSSDLTLKINDLSERVMKPAMSTIINYMSYDCLNTMYKRIYNWVGTAGNTVNSFADFALAPQRLDTMSVPMDARHSVLSPADHWGMLGSQTALYIQNAANSAYRDGSLGKIGGVETRMNQMTPTHTVGAMGGTPLVNGASQNVTYDTAKNAWTQSLITDGWTASAAARVKEGDVFTMYAVGSSGARVLMVNPKTKQVTDVAQQFVVTADGSSDGSGNLTLTISPPIITSGPHQTVNVAPADNAGLTFVGTAATGYVQNMAYHKNTMALAIVPMEMPAAAYGGHRESYKGISLRVIPIYDGTNDISKWRLDMLYGRKVIDPRLATRLSGTA
jgi:hypothetical protein